MICNLWHVKRTNGLFYYAICYIEAVKRPITVYVRTDLFKPARAAIDKRHDVRPATPGEMARVVFAAFLRKVVVHDDFPFLGKYGLLRRTLFCLGAHSSVCHVGHINKSTALQVLDVCKLASPKFQYMPNEPPNLSIANDLRARRDTEEHLTPGEIFRPLTIALFGSDSPKKHYEELFRALRSIGYNRQLSFLVYGHPTIYFASIQAMFPDFQITLVSSSSTTLEQFLNTVDLVVSVAEHEGFGRPIALALAAGIPCFLLTCTVFSEFFGKSATLFATLPNIVNAINTFPRNDLHLPVFYEYADLSASFENATKFPNMLAENVK